MATKKIQILDYTIKQAENANTLCGKTADEFALVVDVDKLKSQIQDADFANKEYVDGAIAEAIGGLEGAGLTRIIVDNLPDIADASDDAIYMVPNTTSTDNNIYDEYMVIGDNYELIGNTSIDLSSKMDKVDGLEITSTQSSDYIGKDVQFDSNGQIKVSSYGGFAVKDKDSGNDKFNIGSMFATLSMPSISLLGNYIEIDGGDQTVIKGVVDPVNDNDAVNKHYVDSVANAANKMDKFGEVQISNGMTFVNTNELHWFAQDGINILAASADGLPSFSLNNNGGAISHHNLLTFLVGTSEDNNSKLTMSPQEVMLQAVSDTNNVNGSVVIDENGTTITDSNGVKIHNVATPTIDTDAANKSYVDDKVSKIELVKIVTELPEIGESNKTYFVTKDESEENNIYDEWMWVNGSWEYIGTKQFDVDLADYVKKTDYAGSGYGLVKNNTAGGVYITNGVPYTVAASKSEISGRLSSYKIISSKNYDYAVKRALVDNTLAGTDDAWTDEEKKLARDLLGVTDLVGDIETALDNIISIQENLIGGAE